jgi:hypothetical protein
MTRSIDRKPPAPTSKAGLAAIVAVSCLAVGAASAGAVTRPPARVSARQLQTFPVLARPPAKKLPRNLVRQLTSGAGLFERAAPNPELARALTAPGSAQPHDWYLIPGRRWLCLFTKTGVGGCVTDAEASAGQSWLQLIKPVGHDPRSPLPPVGTPVTSTIYGVRPPGITSVTATTSSGSVVAGALSPFMYSIQGVGLQTLHFAGPTLDVPLPALPQPPAPPQP